jgi:hypothetical protein
MVADIVHSYTRVQYSYRTFILPISLQFRTLQSSSCEILSVDMYVESYILHSYYVICLLHTGIPVPYLSYCSMIRVPPTVLEYSSYSSTPYIWSLFRRIEGASITVACELRIHKQGPQYSTCVPIGTALSSSSLSRDRPQQSSNAEHMMMIAIRLLILIIPPSNLSGL